MGIGQSYYSRWLLALLGVAPTAMIIFFWGGGLVGLISPEASLFYILFGVVGVILGSTITPCFEIHLADDRCS